MSDRDGAAKAVVREFIARFNAGSDPWALIAEEAMVTVNGTTPLSGRYPGVELIRGILVDSALVAVAALSVSVSELIGAGPRVAALLRISGRTVAGLEFNKEGRLCGCAFGVQDGKIEEIVLYADTSLIEIALYGRKYVPDA